MKKIFMVLTVLLIMIIPNFKVEALEDSFYEESIDDYYVIRENNEYEKIKLLKRTSDNKIVYQVKLGQNLITNKMMNGYDNNHNEYLNLDYSTWEKIMLISYYGYGYANHTDIKWYIITQFMIWKETNNNDIYLADSITGDKINIYEDEIEEINNLVSNHSKKPSFNKIAYKIKYKEAMTIRDAYKVLDSFDIISDNKDLEIIKNNNSVTVKSNAMSENRIEFIKEDKQYKNNPIVYIDNNNQAFLSPGKYTPIKAVLIIKILTTDLIINNLDLETKTINSLGTSTLIGSKFELYDIDNQLIKEMETNSEGKLIFKDIGYGKYYLKQVKPGEGYLLNDKVYDIDINDKDNVINIYNQTIKNKIVFNKYINNDLPESNAMFSIYNNDNKKILTFTTNENGYYELELPYGKYTVKQEKGLSNYHFIDDFEINVSKEETQNFNLYSEEIITDIYQNEIIEIDNEEIDQIEEIKETVTEESLEEEIITEVPNTISKESSNSKIYLLLVLIGLYIIKKEKRKCEIK